MLLGIAAFLEVYIGMVEFSRFSNANTGSDESSYKSSLLSCPAQNAPLDYMNNFAWPDRNPSSFS